MLFTVHYSGDYRERGMGQGDGRGRWERGMGDGDYKKVMGKRDYKKRTAEGQNLIPIKLLIDLVMHFLIEFFSLGMKLTVSKLTLVFLVCYILTYFKVSPHNNIICNTTRAY